MDTIIEQVCELIRVANDAGMEKQCDLEHGYYSYSDETQALLKECDEKAEQLCKRYEEMASLAKELCICLADEIGCFGLEVSETSIQVFENMVPVLGLEENPVVKMACEKIERGGVEMKTAKEIFAKDIEEWGSYFSSYQPILEEFGDIAIQVDDVDYQGDSRVLYDERDRFGYLQFGWGSCSGCDALQACTDVEEVQELMDDLYNAILWFDTKADALHYFKNHDWEGDYSWHQEEQKEFVKKVIVYLSK